jgi:hypothetical protein
MNRESIIRSLVSDYGVEEEDARKAVGLAEDFIAEQVELGADGGSITENIYRKAEFWQFELVQPTEVHE